MKDSDIASLIASEVNLNPEIEATGTKYRIYSRIISVIMISSRKSKRIGYEMMMDDKKFIFRKSKENQSPKNTLEYRKDLQGFRLQMRALTEGSKVELRGWDIKSKKESPQLH